ncbi:MAG: hypothetical protein IJZ98_01680 [Bacteroidales bacterium]|nr:hypothetical protein [Bacteroidales bacterium]
MKSFFTKLGTLLLCGVAVAVVGCTDFSQDIQAGDAALKGEIDKLAEATAENLSKAISGLETQLKADLAALQTTHSTDITKLTAEIEALEKALEAAENAHATDKAAAEKALADLQTALANAKSALETEIASVKAELQKEIDAAEAAAAAGIKANADGVAANKALIDGLTTQLAALEATVDAIDVRLTETEADVKSLQDDLAAFKGDYQVFYGQVVNTIQNHANALSTLEADLEAGDAAVKKYVDTMVEELTKKIETVEQTLTSVNNLLDDEVKARVEGDEELNKKIEDTQKALTNVLNLLDDEVKNRTAADKEIQDYISDLEMRLQNKLTVVDNALADLNDGLSDLRKELSEEFASQISVVQNAISSIIIQHNELAEKVNGLDAALKAQTEALQAMKDAYEAKMAELDETDVDLYNQYEKLQEVITTLNNHITDLQAEDEALAASINGVQEALSQYMRVDAEQTAELKKEIEDEILEKFNMLVTLLSATEERLTAKVNHIFDRVIANEIKIADLQEQTAELENAVAALQGAHATLTEQLQNKLTVLDNQIEALQEADGDNATAIKALQDAHAVLTEQLQNKLSVIDDTIEELTEAIEDNKKAIEKNGASIEANAELIAKNAADIIAANQVVAEFKAAYEVFASNVDYALTNLTTATETNRNDIEGLLENVAEIQETLSGVQEDLTAAIGRIDVLEDAVKALEDAHAALIEGLQNKFTATDKEITDLQDANDALAAELKKAVKELYDNDQKNLDNLSNRLASHTDKLAKMIYAVEERLGKAEGKIADLEEQTAELETAIKNLQDAHALLEYNLQQKLSDLDKALEAIDETHKDDVKDLQNAHARLNAQLEEALGRINTQIEALQEAVADNKKAIEKNGAAIEDNAELIAENAELITETKVALAELQGNFQTFAQNVEMVLTNHSSSIKSLTDELEGVLEVIEDINADIDDIQEDLAAAIGRIDALEDTVETIKEAYAVLIEGLTNKFGATDKDIADLQDAIDALKKALAEEVKKLYDNDQKNLDNLSDRLAMHTDKLAKMIYALTDEVDTIAARVQSLVYVPDYADGKVTVNYGVVPNVDLSIKDPLKVVFVPAKTTLRYKVNSTSTTIVDDIVAAYETNPEILSFDVEGVKVRGASAGNATLEIVGVSKDADGYLAVDVLARNFDKSFFFSSIQLNEVQNSNVLDQWFMEAGKNVFEIAQQVPGTKGYSVSLVLAQADKKTDVASEFTNLVASRNYDILRLAAKYNNGQEGLLSAIVSVPSNKTPVVKVHNIPSSDTTSVQTSTSYPVVQFERGGQTITCTPEELYNKYGYAVNITSHRYIASYSKPAVWANILGIPVLVEEYPDMDAAKGKDWNSELCAYSTEKFNVTHTEKDCVGHSRKVSLPACDTQDAYKKRVGSYLEVVDTYYLEYTEETGAQSVSIADKVNITKNIVRINFPTKVNYKWTLQRALDLRGTAPKGYGKDIEVMNVPYTNIYNLEAVLGGTVKEKVISLNGEPVTDTDILIEPLSGPSVSGGAGTAKLTLKSGYKFAADKENLYTVEMLVDFDETTDAIITATIALGQLPEKVEVVSEAVSVYQVPGTPDFKADLPLVKMAYDEFSKKKDAKGKDYINFNAENELIPYQVLFDVLTDANNKVTNTPESLYNMNFNVVDNVDKTNVMLFGSQWTAAGKPETLTVKRVIDPTWFGVPFEFTVPLKPVLPEIDLVRSTEYAAATGEDDVYSVDVQARVIGGVYTVKQSDLAKYLNVVGKDVDNSQTVKFRVMDEFGYSGIISTSDVVNLTVLDAPVDNPLVGKITANLEKNLAVLTWTDKTTQIKVKAELYSNQYLMDEVVLILNVEDPLSFVAKNFEKARKIEDDTTVSVFQTFSLKSNALDEFGEIAHPGELIQYGALTVDKLVTDLVAHAYGIKFTLTDLGVYERVTLPDGNTQDVLYDDSKFNLDLNTGVFTLYKDDAAKLLNPIVARITVSYEHNVHSTSSTVCKPVTYEIMFVNEVTE